MNSFLCWDEADLETVCVCVRLFVLRKWGTGALTLWYFLELILAGKRQFQGGMGINACVLYGISPGRWENNSEVLREGP